VSTSIASRWWKIANVLLFVNAMVTSLLSLAEIFSGLAIVLFLHRPVDTTAGILTVLFGLITAMASTLYWWGVISVNRGSNTARWILGLLAAFAALATFVSLASNGIFVAISLVYNGTIVYTLLINTQVRTAFVRSHGSNAGVASS
jgi:hypothetical protein